MLGKCVQLIFCFFLVAAFVAACRYEQSKGFDPARVVQVEAGAVDFFGPVKATLTTSIRTFGWAADLQAGNPAKDLVVVCDGKQVPVIPKISSSRPDVAKNFHNDNFENTGWEVVIPASSLGTGRHKLEFYALLTDNTYAPLYCGALKESFKFCEVEVVR